MEKEKSTVLDVISGNESIKFSIGLAPESLGYLAVAAIAVGVILIFIAKKVK